ncbi:LPS-assembly protein LptD [soil metagenome]
MSAVALGVTALLAGNTFAQTASQPSSAAASSASSAASSATTSSPANPFASSSPSAAASAAAAASAPSFTDAPLPLQPSQTLGAPLRGDAARRLPIIVRADNLRGRPNLETIAEGNAEFRQGTTILRADKLTYDHADNLARAQGGVRIVKDGNLYTGPELQMQMDRFEGYFLEPTYFFSLLGAGGKADRVDFIDSQRLTAIGATYSSCLPDGTGAPAWLLSTSRVKLDFETNTGVAEGAVLRFYDIPILAAPSLSFPLNDARKSGWLPPTVMLDSKSGFGVQSPYYWNIAPNRDATITPFVMTKRGVGAATQFRYLEPDQRGTLDLNLLPWDRLAGRERYGLRVTQEGLWAQGISTQVRVNRVSDDNYWKDFTRDNATITPRLLATDLQAKRVFGDWTTYGRVEQWQVLQVPDPTSRITEPYQRSPQLGGLYNHEIGGGLVVNFQGEYNRFTLPPRSDPTRPTGDRVSALGALSRPYVTPGWSLIPKVAFNAASYTLDRPTPGTTGTSFSRVIPTISVDSAWTFERDTSLFGKSLRQTLEPRLMYVNTPYRNQNDLPNFDAFARDFNFETIYTENAFSGIDRVSDAHQVTAGVITRLLDPGTGAENLRLGAMQRYLLREQLITPDGVPQTKHFSDILLLASTSALVPRWTLDAAVQYSPDTKRTQRSVIGARYSPGPFRTVNLNYRLTRGLSEQVELGWQWPLYGPTPLESADGSRGGSCGRGGYYTVGRVNYSTSDRRVTDSIFGAEYDAGCWIGRVVAERLSTGRSEATTRLLLQLEFVGLSRLGSNPLQTLKDNIPGYRLLREDRPASAAMTIYE